MLSPHAPGWAGVGPRAMRCHASVAHNQILNGPSVILSPFIGVELTSWKARTLPQVTAVLSSRPEESERAHRRDKNRSWARKDGCGRTLVISIQSTSPGYRPASIK